MRAGGLGLSILVTELMWPEGLAVLRGGGETVYAPELWRDPQELRRRMATVRAVVVRNLTRVDGDLLAAAANLAVVGRLGSGLDNIDLDAARRHGAAVVYAPAANTGATAEFTLALCLAVSRRLLQADAAGRSATWNRRGLAGAELTGSLLGVVGLGRVGSAVARRARALGMEVCAHHPGSDRTCEARDVGARLTDLGSLLRQADLVTLHLSLTPQTRHFIGARQLALMKPSAHLVNTARGALVDEVALHRAVSEGWIAGAALDVREQEPPPLPDPMAALPGVILTPHVAGLSDPAQRLTCTSVAEDVLRVLRGERPRNAVRG